MTNEVEAAIDACCVAYRRRLEALANADATISDGASTTAQLVEVTQQMDATQAAHSEAEAAFGLAVKARAR